MNKQMESKSNNINVAIYIRVSTNHQIDRDSLPMQKKDLAAYARLILNTCNYTFFEDAGYSGKNTLRPKLQEMMTKIRQGLFTHVLVWKIDRISRNLLDFAAMYKELKDLGVTFISKSEQFDTSTAIGEAMLKIILVFAELERNMTSERVTATMISRASNGLWNGGRVPYGYNYNYSSKTFSINETEAKIVKLIHDNYEKEQSLVHNARFLNDSGYKTRAGLEWSPTGIMIILHNIFYCGDYRYNVLKEGNRQKKKDKSEWITIKNHHPQIIKREQKDRIIKLLKTNIRLSKKNNTRTPSKHVHIFRNLVFCAECGCKLNSTIYKHKKDNCFYSRYLCPSKRKSYVRCNNKSITDVVLGEFTLNYILNILNAKKEKNKIKSTNYLQSILLKGATFNYIDHIDTDSLNEIYLLITSNKNKTLFANLKTKNNLQSTNKQLRSLKKEKIKQQRALDRLTNLFLFDEAAISEHEFVVRKEQIIEKIESIDSKLINENAIDFISDDEFIKQASEFIIAKNLKEKQYISYNRLINTIDKNIIKDFISTIIDRITILDGKIKSIIFKNGLSQNFILKKNEKEP